MTFKKNRGQAHLVEELVVEDVRFLVFENGSNHPKTLGITQR